MWLYFIDDILLICSAVKLPVCLINSLTYLLKKLLNLNVNIARFHLETATLFVNSSVNGPIGIESFHNTGVHLSLVGVL